MEKYVELIKDHYPYKKGTQFEVTNEDEGMWSLYAFYSGEIDGAHFSCEQEHAKLIGKDEYSGRVIRAPQRKRSQEEIDDYMNPLNHP